MKFLALALASFVASFATPQSSDFSVSAEERDGDWWCSVIAQRANLRDLLDALAIKLDFRIEGLTSIDKGQEITVDLDQRSLRDVLSRLAGAVGAAAEVRTHTLVIKKQAADAWSADELRGQAVAAYLRALRAFPEHPGAAHAKLEQGRIEEARGNVQAALAHYDSLIQRNKTSELFPEALMRSSSLLMQTKEWDQASQRLTELLRLDRRHPYEIQARMALARCEAMLGDHQRCFYMLDVIETYAPSMEPDEIQRRLLIRARAQLAAGKPDDATESLARVERLGEREEFRLESLELGARIAEVAGDPHTACKSWLAYAQRAEGVERGDALDQAARLALDSGDEVAALFIARLAERSKGGQTAADIRARVARSLGVAKVAHPSDSASDSLSRAERLVASGAAAEAAPVLKSLYADRSQLDEAQLLRVVVAYARALDANDGVEAAVALLRDALADLHDNESRRALYLLAGELYEARDRLDEAVEAYQGRL